MDRDRAFAASLAERKRPPDSALEELCPWFVVFHDTRGSFRASDRYDAVYEDSVGALMRASAAP